MFLLHIKIRCFYFEMKLRCFENLVVLALWVFCFFGVLTRGCFGVRCFVPVPLDDVLDRFNHFHRIMLRSILNYYKFLNLKKAPTESAEFLHWPLWSTLDVKKMSRILEMGIVFLFKPNFGEQTKFCVKKVSFRKKERRFFTEWTVFFNQTVCFYWKNNFCEQTFF